MKNMKNMKSIKFAQMILKFKMRNRLQTTQDTYKSAEICIDIAKRLTIDKNKYFLMI